jgi:hypothetical protein
MLTFTQFCPLFVYGSIAGTGLDSGESCYDWDHESDGTEACKQLQSSSSGVGPPNGSGARPASLEQMQQKLDYILTLLQDSKGRAHPHPV